MVLTYNADARGNSPILYVNAAVRADFSVDIAPSGTRTTDAGSNFRIGNSVDGSRTHDGLIDEVRLYKGRILTVAEVTEHYAGVFADETGLAAHYKMDEGTGTSVADSSGNANTGTLSGAGATWSTTVHSPLDETVTWATDKIFHTVASPASHRYWRTIIESPAGTETMKKILLLNRALGAFEKGVA